MPVWTVYIAHQNSVLVGDNWGPTRKWKTFEVNKKVRMDSPSEFSATIKFDPDVTFNDLIKFERDDTIEWIGFVEDMEIAWDESGRYLNMAGRDLTLLLWRKYVENFNNAISGTEGFFGNVNASELIKFLLRTPRSDLPEVPDDNDSNAPSVYPYNKEGWGIDISNFLGLEAQQTAFGDINTTILRKREMLWSNSGSPYMSNDPASYGIVNGVIANSYWDLSPLGTPPYINVDGGTNPVNYIKSQIHKNATIDFSFEGLKPSDNPSSINNCFLIIKEAPDGTWDWWDSSNCYVYIWVDSYSSWCLVGNFGGRSSSAGLSYMSSLSWRTISFDISNILKSVSDIANAKVRFVETGSLSTYIEYCCFSVGYTGSGQIQKGEWVKIMFNPIDCMGVYIESREDAGQFPENYHITTRGDTEYFTDYITHNASDNYISLNSGKDVITFDSWQSTNPNKIAYFYKDYGSGNIKDGFDESFSFMITSSQPTTTPPNYDTPAFVPFCLSDATAGVNDFYTLWNGSGNVTAFCIVNFEGSLFPQAKLNSGGSKSWLLGLPININQQYWLHVTIVGSTITYTLYSSSSMEASSIVFSYSFTCDTYEYRYQAVTCNNEEWCEKFDDSMDSCLTGEQVVNGGFETGDFTGWDNPSGNPEIVTTSPHSGTYCVRFYAIELGISQDFDNISKADASSFTLWHRAVGIGANFFIKLKYSDASDTIVIITEHSGTWVKVDLLSNWVNGKILTGIDMYSETGALVEQYIDDVSLVMVDSGWNRSGGTRDGTATRKTNTSAGYDGGYCQEIDCTTDDYGFYFEKTLLPTVTEARVDAYVKVPSPQSDSINNDVYSENGMFHSDYSGGSWGWGMVGANPYIDYNNGSGDMGSNHVYFIPAASATPYVMYEYWSFENLPTATGKQFGSFGMSGTSNKIKIKARLQDGTGGSPSCTVDVNIWVQHANGGIGEWQYLTTANCYSIDWNDILDMRIDEALGGFDGLNCQFDWDHVKVRIDINAANDDMVNNFYSIQIGYIAFHANGTGYYNGQIDLMRVYNNDIAGGPDPLDGWLGGIYCALDSTSSTDPDKWRFGCDAYWSGETGSTTTNVFGVLNQWYYLRLYVKVSSTPSATDGYVKLYLVTGGSESLLCQLTGINNYSFGPIDTLNFQMRIFMNKGGSYVGYLDDIVFESIGETYTTGYIYAGDGPEQTLVTVTGNKYPDILHSWCPQKISDIKIIVDDEEDDHGWEITQIYVYKTDPVKYRVVLDDCTDLTDEYKLTFSDSGYTLTANNDIGLEVYHNSYGTGYTGSNYIGILLSANDDIYEWRVDITGGNYVPIAGDIIVLATHDGGAGTGTGTLESDSKSVYSGGPYLYLSDTNIDLSGYKGDPVWIGPTNIPKNRLLDTLWDICVYVNDNYQPFEWWISYPSTDPRGICIGDFHIGSRKGSDMSSTVSFTTGINMESAKVQKSSRDTYQRCQLIGTGEGKNQDDCSSFWQDDQDAMDEIQGFIEDIVTQKQVSGGRVANRYAKVKLKLDASPKRKNGIECVIGKDTYDSGAYDVGDDVVITDPLTGLGPTDDEGGVYRIWNSKISGDDNGEKVVLTVQAPYLDISNVWKDVYNKLKQLGAMGTIAQDWAGDGTNSDKVTADKLTDLFSITAKNEETTPTGSTDPKWEESPDDKHGAGYKMGNSTASIWGGDGATTGVDWIEARYNGSYDTKGNLLKSDICNIPMNQEPKFTTTFKVYEGVTPTYWNEHDYADFGMFDRDDQRGFLFRVVCNPVNQFKIYAVYSVSSTDYSKTIEELVINGNAKLIRNIVSNHKYKAVIEVEYNSGTYGNQIPEVVFTITDEEADLPSKNVVFTKFNSPLLSDKTFGDMTVRPIYLLVSGGGGGTFRCQMNFYEIKTQRDVV